MQHLLTYEYKCHMAGVTVVSYNRHEPLTFASTCLLHPLGFGEVLVAHFFCVVFCLFCRCVCLPHVSCVPIVASVSGLSILDYPFCYLQIFLYTTKMLITKLGYQKPDNFYSLDRVNCYTKLVY